VFGLRDLTVIQKSTNPVDVIGVCEQYNNGVTGIWLMLAQNPALGDSFDFEIIVGEEKQSPNDLVITILKDTSTYNPVYP